MNRLNLVDFFPVPLLDRIHIARESAGQRPPRLTHNAGDAAAAAEHHLELLERAAHGLGVEEEHSWYDDGGDDEEDEVVLPSNCLNSDWRGHVDHEIKSPVVCCRQTGHGDTEAGGCDFGAVEEVGAEETDGNEEVEEEDEERRGNLGGLIGLGEGGGDGESQHA